MQSTRSLYLVRHGEVANPNHIVYGHLPGFHLSPLGVRQAHETARRLADAALDRVLTSPLARAVETATAIGSPHGIEPTQHEALTESRQFPHWTGHRWSALADLFPGELESYLENAATAGTHETLEQVASRYASVISDAIDDGCRAVVVVGHQDPIQATRLSLVGRSLSELRHDPPDHGEVILLTRSDQGPWREMLRWAPQPEES